jgi:hypothetical protein
MDEDGKHRDPTQRDRRGGAGKPGIAAGGLAEAWAGNDGRAAGRFGG